MIGLIATMLALHYHLFVSGTTFVRSRPRLAMQDESEKELLESREKISELLSQNQVLKQSLSE